MVPAEGRRSCRGWLRARGLGPNVLYAAPGTLVDERLDHVTPVAVGEDERLGRGPHAPYAPGYAWRLLVTHRAGNVVRVLSRIIDAGMCCSASELGGDRRNRCGCRRVLLQRRLTPLEEHTSASTA